MRKEKQNIYHLKRDYMAENGDKRRYLGDCLTRDARGGCGMNLG